MRVEVAVDHHDSELTSTAALALFGLATTYSGATVADLERGEIALTELIETIDQQTSVARMGLSRTGDAFHLTLSLLPGCPPLGIDEGALQLIDAGLQDWSIRDDEVTVTIGMSSARPKSSNR